MSGAVLFHDDLPGSSSTRQKVNPSSGESVVVQCGTRFQDVRKSHMTSRCALQALRAHQSRKNSIQFDTQSIKEKIQIWTLEQRTNISFRNAGIQTHVVKQLRNQHLHGWTNDVHPIHLRRSIESERRGHFIKVQQGIAFRL